jgi:hypothetical protein
MESKRPSLRRRHLQNVKNDLWGGCTLGATGLEDFLALYELHKFNGCFDPQRDLQLIAEAKRVFIEALHQQNCPLLVAPERFPH